MPESGGDNLAANFSRELADFIIYVIDVCGGDKIPRKGGPGVTQADLLVINKIELADAVGASLEVMFVLDFPNPNAVYRPSVTVSSGLRLVMYVVVSNTSNICQYWQLLHTSLVHCSARILHDCLLIQVTVPTDLFLFQSQGARRDGAARRRAVRDGQRQEKRGRA